MFRWKTQASWRLPNWTRVAFCSATPPEPSLTRPRAGPICSHTCKALWTRTGHPAGLYGRFETWVVGEFRKFRLNRGLPDDLCFWRDNNELEADLVFETDQGLQCVEIKSSQTTTPDLVRAGQRASRFVTEPAPAPWLLHGATESYTREGVRCISWQQFSQPLQASL